MDGEPFILCARIERDLVMLSFRSRMALLCFCICAQSFTSPTAASASGYKNFKVAVYVPEYVVEQMNDLALRMRRS